MTEDEAHLKRCCGPSDCGHENDIGPGGPGRYCLASACMAWRWGQKPNPSYKPNQGMSWPPPHPPVPMYVPDDTQGGCGLAGRP